MNLDFMADESERTLAAFFSPMVLAVLFHGIWVASALLLLFWPRQALFHFLGPDHQGPLTFFLVLAATLIITSYINLRCGRGEIINTGMFSEYRKEAVATEKQRDFFQYALWVFLLHICHLMIPYAPLFVLAAAVSGITGSVFLKALSILLTASVLCRMVGFLMYLLWGRFRMEGYLISRTFIIVFIIVTAVFAPGLSPLRVLYGLQSGMGGLGDKHDMGSYGSYMSVAVSIIVFLMLLCQILIRRHIHREIRS
ncbi:MAG: hypothetical protein JRJ04_07415 [Deltaproteobacteria bacterium]|nr:hypothetical protein [Deltaproteobacteria bacterium]